MKLLTLTLAVIILLLIAFLALNYYLPKNSRPQLEINGHTFSLYLAKTPEEQTIGLAKFSKLQKNQGMLFLFSKPGNYSFWMKDMKFPIDIIFINGAKVVEVFENVPVSLNNNLPIYTPTAKADKVLEINAGLVKKYNIKIGDLIKLNI